MNSDALAQAVAGQDGGAGECKGGSVKHANSSPHVVHNRAFLHACLGISLQQHPKPVVLRDLVLLQQRSRLLLHAEPNKPVPLDQVLGKHGLCLPCHDHSSPLVAGDLVAHEERGSKVHHPDPSSHPVGKEVADEAPSRLVVQDNSSSLPIHHLVSDQHRVARPAHLHCCLPVLGHYVALQPAGGGILQPKSTLVAPRDDVVLELASRTLAAHDRALVVVSDQVGHKLSCCLPGQPDTERLVPIKHAVRNASLRLVLAGDRDVVALGKPAALDGDLAAPSGVNGVRRQLLEAASLNLETSSHHRDCRPALLILALLARRPCRSVSERDSRDTAAQTPDGQEVPTPLNDERHVHILALDSLGLDLHSIHAERERPAL
eukprot:750365-Hanusia_phi.AAC.2